MMAIGSPMFKTPSEWKAGDRGASDDPEHLAGLRYAMMFCFTVRPPMEAIIMLKMCQLDPRYSTMFEWGFGKEVMYMSPEFLCVWDILHTMLWQISHYSILECGTGAARNVSRERVEELFGDDSPNVVDFLRNYLYQMMFGPVTMTTFRSHQMHVHLGLKSFLDANYEREIIRTNAIMETTEPEIVKLMLEDRAIAREDIERESKFDQQNLYYVSILEDDEGGETLYYTTDGIFGSLRPYAYCFLKLGVHTDPDVSHSKDFEYTNFETGEEFSMEPFEIMVDFWIQMGCALKDGVSARMIDPETGKEGTLHFKGDTCEWKSVSVDPVSGKSHETEGIIYCRSDILQRNMTKFADAMDRRTREQEEKERMEREQEKKEQTEKKRQEMAQKEKEIKEKEQDAEDMRAGMFFNKRIRTMENFMDFVGNSLDIKTPSYASVCGECPDASGPQEASCGDPEMERKKAIRQEVVKKTVQLIIDSKKSFTLEEQIEEWEDGAEGPSSVRFEGKGIILRPARKARRQGPRNVGGKKRR